MALISAVAVLLVINMVLTHADYLYAFYVWLYKKLKKPKFKVGELVFINDIEFEVILVTKNAKPYTYYCLPVNLKINRLLETYYHESEIKKKTGLLKELE